MKANSESIFLSLLSALFIGLKLTGHIDWSWWWVLSPLWAGLVLVLLILTGVFFHAIYKFQKKGTDKP